MRANWYSFFLHLFLFLILNIYFPSSIAAQTSPEDARKMANSGEMNKEEKEYYAVLKTDYIPQSTPKASFEMELDMMGQGVYCYDLPLFDPAWRKKGHRILTSTTFQDVAEQFKKPFASVVEGDSAIIYYPDDATLPPVFLFYSKGDCQSSDAVQKKSSSGAKKQEQRSETAPCENKGWIIDRTAVENKVFFDRNHWLVLDGDYPYVSILKKHLDMEELAVDQYASKAYKPKMANLKLNLNDFK